LRNRFNKFKYLSHLLFRMAIVIDGKAIAHKHLEQCKNKIALLIKQGFSRPHLAVLLVGDNLSSQIYVKKKQEQCKEAGAEITFVHLPKTTPEQEVLEVVRQWNADDTLSAILVQLPLPEHLKKDNVIQAINKEKDVDGLHPDNLKNVEQGNERICPCTPLGVIKLLETQSIRLKDKQVVIVGYSDLVGKPLGFLCKNRGANVTHCRKTWNNLHETVKGDILISACGVPQLIKKEMVKPGAMVIDVGITKKDGKLYGDVDFENVKEKASLITPVPGGVGPMTVAMVVENLVKLHQQQLKNRLRNEVKRKRTMMTLAEREEKSNKIVEQIKMMQTYQQAKTVMLYAATAEEVQTQQLIEDALASGKRVALPFVEGEHLRVGWIINRNELEPGSFGILEPKKVGRKILTEQEIEQIEIVIIPGVVFDECGDRIGFGKGYYDKLLKQCKGVKIGLAFAEQMRGDFCSLTNEKDMKMNQVVWK